LPVDAMNRERSAAAAHRAQSLSQTQSSVITGTPSTERVTHAKPLTHLTRHGARVMLNSTVTKHGTGHAV